MTVSLTMPEWFANLTIILLAIFIVLHVVRGVLDVVLIYYQRKLAKPEDETLRLLSENEQ